MIKDWSRTTKILAVISIAVILGLIIFGSYALIASNDMSGPMILILGVVPAIVLIISLWGFGFYTKWCIKNDTYLGPILFAALIGLIPLGVIVWRWFVQVTYANQEGLSDTDSVITISAIFMIPVVAAITYIIALLKHRYNKKN